MGQTTALTKRPFAAAFSGHRNISEEVVEPLRRLIKCELVRLIEQERYQYFASGGASGFDMLAAQAVLAAFSEKVLACTCCVASQNHFKFREVLHVFILLEAFLDVFSLYILF